MKRFFIISLLISQLMSLTSCASMNSNFDCPNKAGVNCRSLDQINKMVDTGDIQKGKTDEVSFSTDSSGNNFQSFPINNTYLIGQPMRYGETVQRIWFAPYEDTEGNYHADNLMYSVVQNGHWIGHPVKSEINHV